MRKYHVPTQITCGLAALLFTPLALSAQSPQSLSSLWQRTEARSPAMEKTKSAGEDIMNRPIAVNIKNLRLVDAVQVVVKAAKLKVTFTDDFAKSDTRVSWNASESTVKDAFVRVLSGTAFQARIILPDEVVISRRNVEVGEQDSAVIRVVVIDSVSQQPIQNVMIEIAGTSRRLLTDAKGVVVLPQIADGTYRITARRLGYRTKTLPVTVQDGKSEAITFAMTVTASDLTEVVTTGASERAKLEVGTSIATINADSIMATTPVSTVSELLATRIPGLTAMASSGAVGSPTRIRIRGNTSIEGVNEPLFILDGVRISNSVTTSQNNTIYAGVRGGAGENDFSQRLDDLDPNMIESIEVLKGPTASTLYGSEAANGVVIIKTKRGRAGPTRWTLFADHRELIQSKDYDYAIQQVGYPINGNASVTPTCTLSDMANGFCVPREGEFVGFNMLEDSRFTPIGRGYTQSFGGSASGGVDRLRFSLNGTYLNQLGNAKLPDVNANWISAARGGIPLKKEVLRPNARRNISASAQIDGTLFGNSDFALSTTFASAYMRAGNQGMSALLSEVRPPTDTTPVSGWTDWNGTRTQNVKKVNGSGILNFRPTWRSILLNGSFTYGWDYNFNDDVWYIPRGSCDPLCTSTTDNGIKGYVNAGRRTDFVQTLRMIGGGSGYVGAWFKTDIRFGMDFSKTNYWWLYGNAADLRLGQRFYAASGAKNIQDIGDARATAGYFLEPTVSLRDRIFITGGFRADAGSALGDQVTPTYPKWNASWVVSDEPFFPEQLSGIVDIFRVRFAYGQAGILPTSNARVRTYSASTGFVNNDDTNGSASGSYAQLTGPGNLWVRPERSREYEGGFDVQLWDQRFDLDVTYFRRVTNDAIHTAPLAGSVGAGVTYGNKLNVGNVLNHGFEMMANVRVFETPVASYHINGSIARARNKLTKLDPGVISFIDLNASGDVYTGNATKIVEGYSLFGRWAYPILGYADENGNGIIDPTEVRVADSLTYVGSPQPNYTMGINHSLGFFRNLLTINANFSYVNGMTQYNSLRRSNVARLAPNQGLGSLGEQACVVAVTAAGGRRATDWCFFEKVNTLRWENLAISYQLPPSFVKRIRAASARLSLNANNLALWTNFQGRDPNVNTTPVTLNSWEAGSAFAKPREVGMRLSLTF